jgi:23S rRNA (cytosine1962-C5)-methyltransferase
VQTIRLKKNEERRLLAGHSWIFSNEIHGSLQGLDPGQLVRVVSWSGRFLGVGPINPRSLITIRLLSRRDVDIDARFYLKRLVAADERRKRLYPGSTTYRLAFAEADFLPGLIVDRYDRHLVVQILTQGMAKVEEQLLHIMSETFRPASITLRSDSPARTLEGLPLERGLAWGSLPDELVMEMDGLRFKVALLEGQKTGFYLDQRENRPLLRGMVQDKRVLDGCCYEGAWGLYAARFGAREVVGVDTSETALRRAHTNARANGLASLCRFEQQDIFDFLNSAEDQFDVIVLDPPAFIKSRTKVKEGERGYLDLNRKAMNRLHSGGILVSCSCSHHLDRPRFEKVLSQAARLANKQIRLLEVRGQARDHPVLLAMPETAYLKCFFLEVLELE